MISLLSSSRARAPVLFPLPRDTYVCTMCNIFHYVIEPEPRGDHDQNVFFSFLVDRAAFRFFPFFSSFFQIHPIIRAVCVYDIPCNILLSVAVVAQQWTAAARASPKTQRGHTTTNATVVTATAAATDVS